MSARGRWLSTDRLSDTGHVLLRQVHGGTYPAGTELPEMPDLAQRLGVDEIVVHAATGQLTLFQVLEHTSAQRIVVTPGEKWRIRMPDLAPGAEVLATRLRFQIEQGIFPTEARLPSLHRLAKDLKQHPGAVRDALRLLAGEGRLALQPRLGALVLPMSVPSPTDAPAKPTEDAPCT